MANPRLRDLVRPDRESRSAGCGRDLRREGTGSTVRPTRSPGPSLPGRAASAESRSRAKPSDCAAEPPAPPPARREALAARLPPAREKVAVPPGRPPRPVGPRRSPARTPATSSADRAGIQARLLRASVDRPSPTTRFSSSSACRSDCRARASSRSSHSKSASSARGTGGAPSAPGRPGGRGPSAGRSGRWRRPRAGRPPGSSAASGAPFANSKVQWFDAAVDSRLRAGIAWPHLDPQRNVDSARQAGMAGGHGGRGKQQAHRWRSAHRGVILRRNLSALAAAMLQSDCSSPSGRRLSGGERAGASEKEFRRPASD